MEDHDEYIQEEQILYPQKVVAYIQHEQVGVEEDWHPQRASTYETMSSADELFYSNSERAAANGAHIYLFYSHEIFQKDTASRIAPRRKPHEDVDYYHRF